MKSKVIQSSVAICILGIVVGVVFWWQFGTTAPDAFAAVSQACEKADTVTEYDMTTYVEHSSKSGRIEWQISGDNMYGKTYDEIGHQIDVLIAGNESYYREPGGEWIEAGVDLSIGLQQFPYNSASLCPSLNDYIALVGDGTVDNLPVKRYQNNHQMAVGHSGTRPNPNVYSLNAEGWMVQIEVNPPTVGAHGLSRPNDEPYLRTVFSAIGEPNSLPSPPTQ